jgi:hypothetical protein
VKALEHRNLRLAFATLGLGGQHDARVQFEHPSLRVVELTPDLA